MYNELHDVWRRELESEALERLSSNFYAEVADYLRRLREEGRMIDKRTLKARLLREELRRARRMLLQLAQVRYRKLVRELIAGEKESSEVLSTEEERIFAGRSSLYEAYQSFVNGLLRGKIEVGNTRKEQKTMVLRFVKEMPEIVGADLKTYGPFTNEDVASLPQDNAGILIRQGIAKRVETS